MARQNGRASRRDTGLPAGFKFHPTAVEVILSYLWRKLLGFEVNDLILEFEVFRVNPDMLPMDCSPLSRENEGYYFAPMAENINSQRRDTPNGYWQVIKQNVPVYNLANQIVGFKNRLSFYYNGSVTDWRMTEYRCNLHGNDNVEENYIACKVRRKVKEDEMVIDIGDDSSEEQSSEEEEN